jgi:hypothetical protein
MFPISSFAWAVVPHRTTINEQTQRTIMFSFRTWGS